MCRFLFRGSAPVRTGKDAFEDADMIQQGDPIDAFPDGHVFGREEKPPLFVIVDCPDMTVEEGRMLCAPMQKPRNALGNVDRLKPIASARSIGFRLADIKPAMTRAEIMAVLKHKQPAVNPLAIGNPLDVIG